MSSQEEVRRLKEADLLHEDGLLGEYSANDPKDVRARNSAEGAWNTHFRNDRRDNIHMDDRGDVASWDDEHNHIYHREDEWACREVLQKGRGDSQSWDCFHPC